MCHPGTQTKLFDQLPQHSRQTATQLTEGAQCLASRLAIRAASRDQFQFSWRVISRPPVVRARAADITAHIFLALGQQLAKMPCV